MKAWVAILGAMLVVAISFVAWPTQATGGHTVSRIVAPGDAYVIGISSTCPRESSGPPLGEPFYVGCWLLRSHSAYDGFTGAYIGAYEHVNHAFRCEVVASATGVAFNGLPFPANMAGADSIRVISDCVNCDMYPGYTQYGGRVERPPIGAMYNRISGALGNGDVVTAATAPLWWAEQVRLNGPTPVVEGFVDWGNLWIFNEGGFDVTVECTF